MRMVTSTNRRRRQLVLEVNGVCGHSGGHSVWIRDWRSVSVREVESFRDLLIMRI